MAIRDPFANKFISNDEAQRRGWLKPDGSARDLRLTDSPPIATGRNLAEGIEMGSLVGGLGPQQSPSEGVAFNVAPPGFTVNGCPPIDDELAEKTHIAQQEAVARRVPRYDFPTRADARDILNVVNEAGADIGITPDALNQAIRQILDTAQTASCPPRHLGTIRLRPKLRINWHAVATHSLLLTLTLVSIAFGWFAHDSILVSLALKYVGV